jgi:hypothetical protein
MFLTSAGGAALALPFMPSLLPRTIKAQPPAPTKRFIGIMSFSGQFVSDWYPTHTPAGYQLRDTAVPDVSDGTTHVHQAMEGTPHRWAPLSDFAGPGLSNVLTNRLDPYLDKMNLVRGIDLLQGTSHGSGMFLGNYAACASSDGFRDRGLGEIPTIDQVLAYSDRFYPTAPRRRSLELATGAPNSCAYTDYGVRGGTIEQLPAYLEPQEVWDDLFGDFMSPDMPREDPNRSLINAIHGDYARLRENRRLSGDDRQTLERYMSFLDDVERELGATVSAECVRPERPEHFGIRYPYAEAFDGRLDAFRRNVSLLVDMAVAALICDLTRVVTFRCQMALSDALGAGSELISFHQSDDNVGDWHDFAHDAQDEPGDHAHIVALNRWIGNEIFGRFVEQLDVDEGDGTTVLDNSLVYWGGELSMDHYVLSQPTLLAGSAGGALETGRYIDYNDFSQGYANRIGNWGILVPGLPHNRLMVTIMQAMGLSPEDYERDGLAGYGHRERFGGPYAYPDDAYDMTQIGAPLPGLYLG